jgi:hypothetical protein
LVLELTAFHHQPAAQSVPIPSQPSRELMLSL